MPTQILRDAKLYFGGFNLTGDMNALALDYSADMQDDTVLGDDTKSNLAGLRIVQAHHEGLWNGGVGNVDETLFNNIAIANQPMTIAPLTGADGELAYSFLSNLGKYSPGGSVGDIFKFSVSAEGSSNLVRGTILLQGAKTVTGNGVSRNLGAVSATQKLYAALHVVAVAGTNPTFDAILKSAVTDFATITNRITFAQAVAIGSQWATPVPGPITDTFWRLDYVIGGTAGPSFTVLVNVGIQ
jgi:hypothetical protein